MAQTTIEQYIRRDDIDNTLISSIDNGVIILDSNLKIFHYNKWLELHTNIKEPYALDNTLGNLFPQINTKTLKRKIKTALRMGTPTFYTASTSKYLIPIKIDQINISSYSYMQQDVSIIPFDIKNELVALIITDQTNMANTQALLEENIKKVKELNKQLIKERETIDEKVLLLKIDRDYQIADVSKAYLKLCEYTKNELLGTNFFEFEKLHINNSLKTKIIKHIEDEQVFKFEEKTLSNSGTEFWMKNTLIPEYDTYDNYIGSIIFRENITDAKELYIHQDKLLINSRSSAMGEMISMIAHQWRQPLSVINMIISKLKIKQDLGILNEQLINETCTKIEDTVQYLSATIDDFRNFFKQNKVLTNISVSKIFEKSTTLLKEEMKINEIKYIELIDSNIKIQTYQNELVQSIINIIKNSIDAFNKDLHYEKKIVVVVKKEKTHLSLKITDNAGGINKEIISKIFEPYFSTKSKNGTGLGLYMCKTIIENNLKGQLTITSSDNETQTLIELPYKIKKLKELK